MKLKYKILWVEDEEDYIQAFPFSRIEEHIRESGFEPEIEFRTSPADVRRVVDKNEFDLLVVDFKIADDEYHGSDLIQEIRQNNCLTEVVFYSGYSPSTLHQEAGEKGLEGIYFGPKNADSLIRKITDVFDLTVRKVLDVNNMRGFVMAGVAELDHLLNEIIDVKHSRLPVNEQVELRRKIVQKMLPPPAYLTVLFHELSDAKVQELAAVLDAIGKHEPAVFEVLCGRRMDSAKRVSTIVSLCKQHDYLKPHKTEILEMNSLLHWRNALAHQQPKTSPDGAMEFEVEGVSVRFDDAQTLELRKQIRRYLAKLTTVLDEVRAFNPS